MTHLPDIINQKMNEYAPAMDALAKGEEMSECDHVFRFYTNKEVLMVCLNCGLELNADDISLRMETLKNAAEYMANELAARDALIERLVEAGSWLAFNLRGKTVQVDKWDVITSEYRAMKGGEG